MPERARFSLEEQPEDDHEPCGRARPLAVFLHVLEMRPGMTGEIFNLPVGPFAMLRRSKFGSAGRLRRRPLAILASPVTLRRTGK